MCPFCAVLPSNQMTFEPSPVIRPLRLSVRRIPHNNNKSFVMRSLFEFRSFSGLFCNQKKQPSSQKLLQNLAQGRSVGTAVGNPMGIKAKSKQSDLARGFRANSRRSYFKIKITRPSISLFKHFRCSETGNIIF